MSTTEATPVELGRWRFRPTPWDDFLLEGEIPRYRDEPQIVMLFSRIWLNLVALLVVLIVAVTSSSTGLRWLADAGMLLLVVEGFVEVQRWRYSLYVLTDLRAMRFDGWLRRDCEWLSWGKVTEVSVRRSWLERKLNVATIEIHTANSTSSFRAMRDVEKPLEFARLISELSLRRSG